MYFRVGDIILAVLFFLAAVFFGWFSLRFWIIADIGLNLQVKPKGNHTAAVIFLHGLSGTGKGISAIFNGIRQPHIKYVFPTAKLMPVTMNHGRVMHSWFDIYGLKSTSKEAEASIEAAGILLQTFIAEQEDLGIKRDRIVVGGLSQGGATSLYSLFAIPQSPVAGIIGLITWLPLHKKFPGAAKANLKTPVLLCHGDADKTVSLEFGQLTAKILRTSNQNVEFKTYPGLAHRVNDKVMKDVENFINKCLP